MMEKRKQRINIIIVAIVVFGLFFFCLAKPDTEVSVSERRKLKTMPKVSVETVFGKRGGTSFMDEFEVYAKDQFPMREGFRRINAVAGRTLLGRKEINDYYVTDGYISKIEDGVHARDFVWSVGRIQSVLEAYMADAQVDVSDGITLEEEALLAQDKMQARHVCMAVIPDKNYYLAPKKGYPYLDAEAYIAQYQEAFRGQMDVVSLVDLLNEEDYYRTDTHWKQEEILDVAQYLLEALGHEGAVEYQVHALEKELYGVYYGQAAMPVKPDDMHYVTWEGCQDVKVTCYDTGAPVEMDLYDFEKLEGMDPYEFFLGGSKALITIENPNAPEGELVLYRDSFGSSMAPLLASRYQKVTLVDIRYINPKIVDRFVDTSQADVLFLYSTSVLNNSV